MKITEIILVLFVVVSLGRRASPACTEAKEAASKVVLVGTDLELRCNNTGNVTWWFNGNSLQGNTPRDNNNLILKISNVTVNNTGTYWCGSSWKHGYNISVIVGDIPSKPRSVYRDSVELIDRVHWVASLYTGGIPVCYKVTSQCLNPTNDSDIDCSSNKGQQVPLTTNIHHSKDKKYMLVLTKYLDLYTPYKVCVFAMNALGSSSNCINVTRYEADKTTPEPPPDLQIKERRQGEALLSWGHRDNWDSYPCVIFVSFSKIGDKHNTTLKKAIPALDRRVSIPDLQAHSTYTFYVQSQYNMLLSSPASVTLSTKDSVPKPPKNLQCNSSKPYSGGMINISLSWEAPPKSSRNGILTKYIVQGYYGETSFNKTVNASQTSTMLSGFTVADNVIINMVSCNHYSCGGIGNICTVHGIKIEKLDGVEFPINVVVGTVIGFFLLLIIGISIVCCCYRRKTKSPSDTSSVISFPEIDGPYTAQYDDPEFNYMPEIYTEQVSNDAETRLL